MSDKKPDLSDLKARLGLTKPSAVAPPSAAPSAPSPTSPGPSSARPPTGAPVPQGPPTPQSPAAPSAPASAPAPRALGPPVQARPAPRPKPRQSAPEPAFAPTAAVELEFESGSGLPIRVIALGLVALFVGIAFGYGASQAVFANTIESTRQNDAQEVHDFVATKVQNFKDVEETIGKLSENAADFESAKTLAEADISIGGNILSNRMLFNKTAIANVTDYTTSSAALHAALKDHFRLTDKVDREELEQLAKETEVLNSNEFGVMFDYRHALQNGGEENYVPKKGRLVIYRGMDEEEKTKVKVEVPLSGRESKVDLVGFIPIEKSQILKSGGGTALTRYAKRVREIKFRAAKLAKEGEPTLGALKNIYQGGSESDDAAPAEEPEAPQGDGE